MKKTRAALALALAAVACAAYYDLTGHASVAALAAAAVLTASSLLLVFWRGKRHGK